MSTNIVEVTQSAGEMGQMAGPVEQTSSELVRQSTESRGVVEGFLPRCGLVRRPLLDDHGNVVGVSTLKVERIGASPRNYSE